MLMKSPKKAMATLNLWTLNQKFETQHRKRDRKSQRFCEPEAPFVVVQLGAGVGVEDGDGSKDT